MGVRPVRRRVHRGHEGGSDGGGLLVAGARGLSGRLTPGRRAEDFLWATGIEDTFVPQTRPGHRALDEYQLMGHYEHWREDLALVRDLGLKMVRWGVPWYRLEPFQPGEFDWRWTDQVIPYMVPDLGLLPIVDLMHYGRPF